MTTSVSHDAATDGRDGPASHGDDNFGGQHYATKKSRGGARSKSDAAAATLPWWKRAGNGAARVFHAVKWVALVIVFFLLLAVLASWNMNRNLRYSKQELQQIRGLVRIAARSAEEAERIGRDDPLQALFHANYAVCYVNAAKFMVNEKTIEGLSGARMSELEDYLTQLQHALLSTVEQRMGSGNVAPPPPMQKAGVRAAVPKSASASSSSAAKRIAVRAAS